MEEIEKDLGRGRRKINKIEMSNEMNKRRKVKENKRILKRIIGNVEKRNMKRLDWRGGVGYMVK